MHFLLLFLNLIEDSLTNYFVIIFDILKLEPAVWKGNLLIFTRD